MLATSVLRDSLDSAACEGDGPMRVVGGDQGTESPGNSFVSAAADSDCAVAHGDENRIPALEHGARVEQVAADLQVNQTARARPTARNTSYNCSLALFFS